MYFEAINETGRILAAFCSGACWCVAAAVFVGVVFGLGRYFRIQHFLSQWIGEIVKSVGNKPQQVGRYSRRPLNGHWPRPDSTH